MRNVEIWGYTWSKSRELEHLEASNAQTDLRNAFSNLQLVFLKKNKKCNLFFYELISTVSKDETLHNMFGSVVEYMDL